MTGKKRVLLNWSSGKDSAWALHLLQQRDDIEIVGLLTILTADYNRVTMHGVRRALLEQQAQAVGLPLRVAEIPAQCSNEQYEQVMRGVVDTALADGVTHMAFGDLFLEDVRRYREERLAGTGLAPMFPVWGIPTAQLARDMVNAGLRARVVCVDTPQLPAAFAGRAFDMEFLNSLPEGVDPCGERGEFHTFVYDGPMFIAPINVGAGDVVEREGFAFCDVYQQDAAVPTV